MGSIHEKKEAKNLVLLSLEPIFAELRCSEPEEVWLLNNVMNCGSDKGMGVVDPKTKLKVIKLMTQ
jgi:hypothetical protein